MSHYDSLRQIIQRVIHKVHVLLLNLDKVDILNMLLNSCKDVLTLDHVISLFRLRVVEDQLFVSRGARQWITSSHTETRQSKVSTRPFLRSHLNLIFFNKTHFTPRSVQTCTTIEWSWHPQSAPARLTTLSSRSTPQLMESGHSQSDLQFAKGCTYVGSSRLLIQNVKTQLSATGLLHSLSLWDVVHSHLSTRRRHFVMLNVITSSASVRSLRTFSEINTVSMSTPDKILTNLLKCSCDHMHQYRSVLLDTLCGTLIRIERLRSLVRSSTSFFCIWYSEMTVYIFFSYLFDENSKFPPVCPTRRWHTIRVLLYKSKKTFWNTLRHWQ